MATRDFLQPQFNLGQALLVAEQIRNARQQREERGFALEQRQQEAKRQELFEEAQALEPQFGAEVMQGFEPEMRQQQMADLNLQIKGEQLRAMQAEKTPPIEDVIEKQKRTAQALQWTAQTMKNEPRMARMVHGRIGEMIKSGVINNIKLPEITADMQEWDNLGQQGAALGSIFEDPQQAELTTMAQNVALSQGLDPTDPATRLNDNFVMGMDQAMRDKAKAGQTNVYMSTKTQGAQEDEYLTANENLSLFDIIESVAVNPETGEEDFGQFLGYVPKGKYTVLNVFDKIDKGLVPDSQRSWFERAAKFRGVVMGYRAEEFKRMLGSAQSKQEIKNLTDKVISMDMGSTQFKQAFEALRAAAKRSKRIAEKVLLSGKVLPGSVEYEKQFEAIETTQNAALIGELDRRLAGGEITKQEYDAVKKRRGIQ